MKLTALAGLLSAAMIATAAVLVTPLETPREPAGEAIALVIVDGVGDIDLSREYDCPYTAAG